MSDVAAVPKKGKQIFEMSSPLRLCSVILVDQDFLASSVPRPGPLFIGPGKTEREIGFTRFQDRLTGFFKEFSTIEPVMVVAETVDAMLLRQPRLPSPRRWLGQIIVISIKRYRWLGMPLIQRN